MSRESNRARVRQYTTIELVWRTKKTKKNQRHVRVYFSNVTPKPDSPIIHLKSSERECVSMRVGLR